VEPESGTDRDAMAAGLDERGISSGVYYPRPVYDYPCYREHERVVVDSAPMAGLVSTRCLSLPVHPQLSRRDLDRIIDAVGELHGR
jgi:dTDP-4-amino-4,6-dideoxygalactose transaminase